MIAPISKFKSNPNNPRIIRDDKFKKLVKSIQDFPEMLVKRPLVCFTDIDGKFVVLGGNMRLKASIEAGLTELPYILADDWTEEQKAEFLIKDNVGFGEWNWDELANEWDSEMLNDWGLDVPVFNSDVNLDDFFKDTNEDKLESKMKITLEYTDEDYTKVIDAFSKHAGSKEEIVAKLLGL